MFVAIRTAVLAALVIPATAVASEAQVVTSGKWQIDVQGGGSIGSGSTRGTPIGVFAVGDPLQTGLGAASSRAVSSWYFGDGSLLLNQVNAAFGVSDRIRSLDAALTRSATRRRSAPAVGFRVSRDVTSRLTPEFSFEYAKADIRFTDEAIAAIEESRASFVGAWQALLSTGATTARDVTSTSAVVRGSGHEIALTGALKIRLRTTGRLRPYATAGAGAVVNRGTAPSATLTGNYGFRFVDLFPMNERDGLTVRVKRPDSSFAALFGGGVEYALSPRTGIRGDVRMQVRQNRIETLIDAGPSVTTQSPAFAISTGGLPSVQFSNNPSTGRASSLSGPSVADLSTFKGSGSALVTNATVGLFVRF